MGSEGNLDEKRNLIISQVSFGGFDRKITAKELTDFLESRIGLVWRCRLKTSWTPPDSFPDFKVNDLSKIKWKEDYRKVEPHAFVHFSNIEAAKRAQNAAGECGLLLNGCPLKVNFGLESSFRIHGRRKTEPFKFSNVQVEIGTLISHSEFLVSWKGLDLGAEFLIDPFDDSCTILFTKETIFSFSSSEEKMMVKCNFKLEFTMKDLSDIKLYTKTAPFVMLLQLLSPPLVYYRTADDDIYETVPFNLLDDEDPWIRTMDFTCSGAIGRCNSYKISFSPRYGARLEKAMSYIRERRIDEDWPKLALKVHEEPDYGAAMVDCFYSFNHKDLNFATLFLINCLLHQGTINQFQLSENFVRLLKSQTPEITEAALRHMCSYKSPTFDACRTLKSVQEWLLKNPRFVKTSRFSDDCVEVRRLVITPTRAYCLPPVVEVSNRVLRMKKGLSDRFLRVTFMDEGMQQLHSNVLSFYVAQIVRDVTSNSFMQRTALYKRIRNILSNGFHLCGRTYAFLAFSANQLRDRSAWFVAEDDKLNALSVWRWMGRFNPRNIAKCATRMGLCFSSTYVSVNVPAKEVNSRLPDIKRNGYDFSDGIGKISTDLSMEIAEKLQLSYQHPSAYQIRYRGYKGVVACWPGCTDGYRLCLRSSMLKFQSDHTMLEIVSWTRFQPGYLNRQIVTLLSTLKVPDHVFSKMQDSMVQNLDQMLDDADVSFEVVTTSCNEEVNTAALMLSAGFRPQAEPYLRGMLSSVRGAQVRDLVEKARIFVPKGAWLMGCLDELGVLEHGQCFVQVSIPSLEKCFHRHGSSFLQGRSGLQVIEGTVVLAKNPCLHPGDVRVLEAVNVPELHHLVDCFVFPQKGDRPHTNEASGSDLDGDLYFVTWDENLTPPSKTSWPPMDYTAPEVKDKSSDVNRQDILSFFLRNIVTDNIGMISNAHVVHADLSEDGALDEKCLQLAELAAHAVDSAKTGKTVTMPPHLRPKVYPDFMGKEYFRSYESTKILGRLYRKIKNAYDDESFLGETLTPDDIPYDTDLEVAGSMDFIPNAWECKCSYNRTVNALLSQYKVSREEEVVTGHILSMPKYNSRRQGEMKERLQRAFTALRKEFRRMFEAEVTGLDGSMEDERNLILEQKASAWYQVTYHPRWVRRSIQLTEPEDGKVPVRLSFPWIASDYLVKIKIRARDVRKLDRSKPINSFANYLWEKI